ncbi:MAG: NADPH-dependent FMN reductase [Ferruginibacter sp.]|nr:NADPH-dependent FMN reductase [Rhodoferax sp.]
MSILLIAGSPSERSRSAALLDAVQLHLALRGAEVERVLIRDLSPQALLLADVAHPSIAQAVAMVARAQAIVVATPIYKAAYSGVLKLFLDLLPQTAFKGKTVLPLATGGSPNHMLALDYALRPVLQSLGADHILSGVFATDGQVVLLPPDGHQLDDDLAQRLRRASSLLPVSKDWGIHAAPVPNASVHFSRVRCSV